MHTWKLKSLMHYKDITIIYLKFHLNCTWNLIQKDMCRICTGSFLSFSWKHLASCGSYSLKRNLFRIDPLMTFISFSNLIWTGLLMALKIFLFLEKLKMAKCQLLSYLLGKYSWYKIIILCWLGEIYSQPHSETIAHTWALIPGMAT